MKIYIIWNIEESRPAVKGEEYGGIIVFLAKPNAEAFMQNAKLNNRRVGIKSDYIIREFEI